MLLALVLFSCASSLLALKDEVKTLSLQESPVQLPLVDVSSMPIVPLQPANARSEAVQMSHTSLPVLRQSVRVPQNCPNMDIILKLVNSLKNLIPQHNKLNLSTLKPRNLENVSSILKRLMQRLPNTQINSNPYRQLNIENNNLNYANSKLIDNTIQISENSVLESKQNSERTSSTFECQIILQLLVDTVKTVYNQLNAYCVSTGKCDLTNIAPLTNGLILNNDKSLPAHQYHHGVHNHPNSPELNEELRPNPLVNNHTPYEINHLLENEELSKLHTLLLQELINSNSRPDFSPSNVNSQYLYDLGLKESLMLNNIRPHINNNNANSQLQYLNTLNNIHGSNDLTLQELLLLNNNIKHNIYDNNVNSQIQNSNVNYNVQGSTDLTLQELLLLNNNIKPDNTDNNPNSQIQYLNALNGVKGSNDLTLQELLLLNNNIKPDNTDNNLNSQIQYLNALNGVKGSNDLTLQELLLLNNNIKPDNNYNNPNSQIQYLNALNGVQGSNDLTLQELLLLNNNIKPDNTDNNPNSQIQYLNALNGVKGSNDLTLQELLLLNNNIKPDNTDNNPNSQIQYLNALNGVKGSNDLTLQELLLLNNNIKPDNSYNNPNSQIQYLNALSGVQGSNDLTLQELLLLNNNIKPDNNYNNPNSQIQYLNALNGVKGSNDLTLQELLLLNNNIKPDNNYNNPNSQIQYLNALNGVQGSNDLTLQELLLLNNNIKPDNNYNNPYSQIHYYLNALNGVQGSDLLNKYIRPEVYDNKVNYQIQNPNFIGTSSQSNYKEYLQQLLFNALNSHSNEANVAQVSQNQLNNLSWQQLLALEPQLASQNNINSQVDESYFNDKNIKNYNYNRLQDLMSIKNSPGANINANVLGPLRNRVDSSSLLGVNNITENNNIMNIERSTQSGSHYLLNKPLRSNSYVNQWNPISYFLSKNLNGNVNLNNLYENYPVNDNANNMYSSLNNNYIQNNQAGYLQNSYQNQLNTVTAKINLQKQSAYNNKYLFSNNILGINQGAQYGLYPGISTSPNNYVNPYLINTLVPNNEKLVNYDNQLLVNSPQSPSVSNLDKLNLAQTNNKIIELTYLLKGQNHNEQPLNYVKYKIPYNKLVNDMENLISQKPYLINQQKKLYSQLISSSNLIETSKNLIDVNPEDLVKLTHNDGTLVDAKVVEDQIGLSDEQLKLIRDMNADLSQSNLSTSNASIYKSLNLVEKLIASANPATMVNTKIMAPQTNEATAVPASGISLNGVGGNTLYNSNTVFNPNLNYNLNAYSSPSLNYNSNDLSSHNIKYSYNTYGKTVSPANYYVLQRPYINPLYRQSVGYVSPYSTSVVYQRNWG